MNDQKIEKQIVDKGKTAPRVTPSRVEATIRSEHYFTAYEGRLGALANETYEAREKPHDADADLVPLQLLTFCVLVLENGFSVTG
jgi:hypothetical protein